MSLNNLVDKVKDLFDNRGIDPEFEARKDGFLRKNYPIEPTYNGNINENEKNKELEYYENLTRIEEERLSILNELKMKKDEKEIEKLHEQLLSVDQRKEELIDKLEALKERNSTRNIEPEAKESMAKKMAEKNQER